MNIVLTGFMGTGKTTAGRLLATELGLVFLDMDLLIEEEAGLSVSEIFSGFGEAHFRRLEAETVRRLTAGELGDGLVVSTGGGVVADPENRSALRRWATVVCLTATVEKILERTAPKKTRPLLAAGDREKAVRRLLDERKEAYEDSDLVVDTTELTPPEVVRKIAGFISGQAGRG